MRLKLSLPAFRQPFFNIAKRMALLMLLSICYSSAQAQNFDWVINFGDSIGFPLSTFYPHQNGGTKIISDASGNIYVVGRFCGTVDFDPGSRSALFTALNDPPRNYADVDYFFSKYDSTGKYIWNKQIVMTSGSFYPYLALDSNGHIYVSMAVSGEVVFDTPFGKDTLITARGGRDYDALFMKYDTAGNFIWAKSLQGARNGNEAIGVRIWPVIAVDPVGNIYLSGNYNDTTDFDPGPNSSILAPSAIRVGHRPLNQEHLFLAKYDTDGNFIWVKDIKDVENASSRSPRLVHDIIVSRTGHIYITGTNLGAADFDPGLDTAIIRPEPNNISFLAKYDSAGNYIWAISGGAYVTGTGGGSVLAEDPFGNIYAVGTFQGARDFDPGPGIAILISKGNSDLYLTKYDSNGNYIWAKNVGGADGFMSATGLTLSRIGNIYVTGYLAHVKGAEASIDFNPCPDDTAILRAVGDTGITVQNPYIAQFDASGNYLWAGSLKGVLPDGGGDANSITLDPAGNVYINGRFWHTVDFDPSTNGTAITRAKSPTSADWYIMKLSFNDTVPYPNITTCADSYVVNDIVYRESGRYSQFIPNSSGCADTTINLDLTLLGAIEEPVITVDVFKLGVHKVYNSYQWFKNGTAIPGANDSIIIVNENADYQVFVTDESGCSDTSAIYRVTNYTGIDAINNFAGLIRAYPNPAEDVLYIQAPISVNILLTDIAGRRVMEVRDAEEVSLKELTAGIYFLQIKNKEGILIHTVKLVKK